MDLKKVIGQQVEYKHETTEEIVVSTVSSVLEYQDLRGRREWKLRLANGAVINADFHYFLVSETTEASV